jgi:hypothetical protein
MSDDDETQRSKPEERVDKRGETPADGEQLSGVPRVLKIISVVVSVAATIWAGIWAVGTQYKDLQKELQKGREQEAKYRVEEARYRVDEARYKEQAEKDISIRQGLQQQQDQRSRESEIGLQQLKTDEAKARAQESQQELAQKQDELKTKERIEAAAATAQEDRDVAAAVGAVLKPDDKQGPSVATAALLPYISMARHRPVIVAALLAKSARIDTIEEAQLWLRAARSLSPVDFELIATANRIAVRRYATDGAAEFWYSYRDYVSDPPVEFLSKAMQQHRLSPLVEKEVTRLLPELSPQLEASGFLTITEWKPRLKLLERFRETAVGPAVVSSLMMHQTGEMLLAYLNSDAPKPDRLDIGDCFLPRRPKLHPAAKGALGEAAYFSGEHVYIGNELIALRNGVIHMLDDE